MSFVGVEDEFGHALVADLFSVGVVLGGEVGFDGEAGGGGCGAEVLEYGLVAVEGPACPVLADLAEESVLDGIPLRGTRWVVTHGHRELVAVREVL